MQSDTSLHNGHTEHAPELQETKIQLLEEQRRLKLAQTVGHIGYFERYLDSEEVYWSDELYRIYGIEPQSEPITVEKVISYIHPGDQEKYRKQLQEGLITKQPYESFDRVNTPDGKVRTVNRRCAFLSNEHGEVNRIYGTVQDVTEQYKDKQELKESKDLLQSLFDTSLVRISLLQAVRDESGTIQDFTIRLVNRALEEETGRTDLIGKLYSQEYPGIKNMGLFDLMLQVMESGEPGQKEYYYPHDGFDKWFSTMYVKIDDALVATNLDITMRKHAEAEKYELLESQNQKLFWATLSAQEEERKRVAESLHNGLGQLLYGVKLSLDQLNLNARELEPEQLKQVKHRTEILLKGAINETRRISHELSPAILEDFGLKEAITETCQQLGRSRDLVIDCHFTGLHKKLSKPIEIFIYRTVQELVMNIVKHSRATEGIVKVEIGKKAVELIISDNGTGFYDSAKSNGIGLRTIQNKVKLLGGKFNLTFGKEKDTTVSIRIPHTPE